MQLVNEDLIKNWEKLRLEAYLPTKKDRWTIGWGHTKDVKPGQTITVAQAEAFFDEDVAWATAFVNKAVKVPLTQHQFDALTSWVFNVGEGNASGSTLLRKLNAKDYEGAARQFLVWNKQKGKVMNGLVKRRAEEMAYFMTTDTQEEIVSVPDAVAPLKNLTTSKEALGGLLVAVFGSALPLVGKHHVELLGAIAVALVGLGVMFLANRIWARLKGAR